MNRIVECEGCRNIIVLRKDEKRAPKRCPMCQAQDVRAIGKQGHFAPRKQETIASSGLITKARIALGG